MGKKTRVAFVGCGAFCSGIHAPNVSANPGFEIVAFCDLSEERLAELDEMYQPRYVTTDMERVFGDDEVDAVICGTKPNVRMPIMRLAVKHGKPLFVEKPLCYAEEEVEEMVRLIGESGLPFMVGFNRPYSPIMQAVKPLYQGVRKGNTLMVYRIIGEAQLWPASHKRAIIEEKESTIVHEATHIFDLLNWLTGGAPRRVFSTGGGNMDNIITLDYPRDVWAVVISGDNACSGYPKERLEIDSNHATIVAEGFSELTAMGVEAGFVRRHFGLTGELSTGWETHEEKLERGWAFRQGITEEQKAYGYYYPKGRERRSMKGHYEELEHFRQSIVAGKAPETGVVRGAMAEVTAWRAVESWEKGEPVALDFGHLQR